MAKRKKNRKPKNSNARKTISTSVVEQSSEKHIAYIQLGTEIIKFLNLVMIELKLEDWLVPIIKNMTSNILF